MKKSIMALVKWTLSRFNVYQHRMSKYNINIYKNRTSVHENQLIKDLFTQTLEERRLMRIWPEDLLDEV
jgi:hypothetical protein